MSSLATLDETFNRVVLMKSAQRIAELLGNGSQLYSINLDQVSNESRAAVIKSCMDHLNTMMDETDEVDLESGSFPYLVTDLGRRTYDVRAENIVEARMKAKRAGITVVGVSADD